MATMDIVTSENQKAGSVELSSTVFEAAVRPHLFQAEVRRQLALRRAGTHSSKNRSLASGGGAKPYRQKGTGRARQGTTRAPQWAGGGVAFGPVPRGHEHKLNKKTRRAALRSALSAKLAESAITVVEGLELAEFKTRRVAELLNGLGLGGESVLIVIPEASTTFEASARNIPNVSVVRACGLNVYDVLRHSKLLLTKAGLEAVETRLGDGEKEGAS